MYQVGDFNFSLPAVPYTFVGAPQDVPPLQLNLPGVDFKVVGLVPRDKDGKPLIKDIFPWRRMPYGQPDLPPKPQLSVIYPKTDIRFWTGYLLKRVPGVNSYLERSGEILIAASLSVLAVMLGFKTFRFSLRRRKNPRRLVRRELRSLRKSLKRRYNKEEALSYGRVAKLEAMNILKLGPGLTDKEMIERAPRLARPIVSDFVGYLGKFAESGGDAGRVRAYFLRIKLAMLADKLVSIAKRPFNGEPQ
jgi:hypothetical protein